MTTQNLTGMTAEEWRGMLRAKEIFAAREHLNRAQLLRQVQVMTAGLRRAGRGAFADGFERGGMLMVACRHS